MTWLLLEAGSLFLWPKTICLFGLEWLFWPGRQTDLARYCLQTLIIDNHWPSIREMSDRAVDVT
jgi:hypothetical protein